jgi:hypothetical protein
MRIVVREFILPVGHFAVAFETVCLVDKSRILRSVGKRKQGDNNPSNVGKEIEA